jgi:hypothetical protein
MVFLRQSCPRAIFRGRAGVGGRTFVAIARDRRLVGACFCTFPQAQEAGACESAAVSFSKMRRPRVPTLRLYVFWSFSGRRSIFFRLSSSHRAPPPSRLPPPRAPVALPLTRRPPRRAPHRPSAHPRWPLVATACSASARTRRSRSCSGPVRSRGDAAQPGGRCRCSARGGRAWGPASTPRPLRAPPAAALSPYAPAQRRARWRLPCELCRGCRSNGRAASQ